MNSKEEYNFSTTVKSRMNNQDMQLQNLKEKKQNADTDGETSPFLGSSSSAVPVAGPVRLSPGWEDKSHPFTDDFLERVGSGNLVQPPRDQFKLVFLILVIHGVGTLMPWNMFITAKSYFVDYKLSYEYTGNHSNYKNNFLPYLGFAAQIPNVFFNWLNIFIQIGGNLKTRIVWSIVIEMLVFIATVVLAMLDSSAWPGLFFWLTMGSVVVINMAGGIYQNSVYGIAAKLDYTGAVILGSSISGTFTAIINLASLYFAPSERTAAIYYFITALFVLLLCFTTYLALPLIKFYRYHEQLSEREQELKCQQGSQPGAQRVPYLQVLKKCLTQCINVFLIFFVTLAIFPAVHSDIQMVDPDFIISKKYFVGVLCFLTFNLFAMLGNMIASLVQWPGPRYLWIVVVLRFLFIPFFMLCNYHPTGYEKVFLPNFAFNDWVFWAGGAFMGLTGGYFSSLAMIYCPRSVESEYAPIAGMLGAAFLISGIFAGINFSLLIPYFVSHVAVG